MEQLVSASPKALIFELVPGVAARTLLRLESVTDRPLAFKIKTTNPRRFSVNPASGVLNQSQVLEVMITLIAYDQVPTDVHSCKDKFLLQVMGVPSDLPADITKIWRDVPQSAVRVEKFPVRMEIRDNNLWRKIARAKDMNLKEGDSKVLDAIQAKDDELNRLRTSINGYRSGGARLSQRDGAALTSWGGVPLFHVWLMLLISILVLKLLL